MTRSLKEGSPRTGDEHFMEGFDMGDMLTLLLALVWSSAMIGMCLAGMGMLLGANKENDAEYKKVAKRRAKIILAVVLVNYLIMRAFFKHIW